jgi:hypothetical protein
MRKLPGRPEQYPVKFVLGVSREMDAALSRWRRQQTDVPTRSEAVRRLIEIGLASKPKGRSGGSIQVENLTAENDG